MCTSLAAYERGIRMKRWQRSVGVFVLASMGCAHRQATAPEPAAPPPLAQAAPVPTPPASPAEQSASDVAAVFSGAVVHFNFDQALLTAEDSERLRTVAEFLRSHPDLTIRISGHCDERGTEEYNLALGNKRAGVAERYLVALGIEPRRVQVVSFGSERPADPGHDEQAWARNRRSEVSRNP